MEFGKDVILRLGSDKVEMFMLMTPDDVKAALMESEFVANRAMVWLAYLSQTNHIKRPRGGRKRDSDQSTRNAKK
ncbi:hypothetical protein MMYC01_210517 [Madurella mycetomatis]|uniref:Uncharacterized protein n=1 Tax=Madurella mycetomatis TaxID=100816 RepID=A0A175VQG8_9PEZI|nr:hypothetical protein MMYC01_210517 [Madurella mycetomatis]